MARKLFGVVAAVVLASGAMFALVAPASAADATLTITVHKVITGTPSGDQVFQMHVACVHPSVSATTPIPSQTQSISWNASTDTFSPSNANAVFTIGTRPGGDSTDITCTVTETDPAGATSHTIVCTGATSSATCSSSTDQVTIPYAQSGDASLTVTNDYPAPVTTTTTTPVAPTTAPKVVVAPANFTG